ncbi:MFS transporter [Salinisphaera sp. T31B1]|uniref:MFS transporter n=1 Tax=Salinisphaera sp. T31B1 TaxID=727963 RepID=UPI00333E5BE2
MNTACDTAMASALLRPSAGAVAVATLTVLPLFMVGALGLQLSEDIGVSVSALGIASAAFFGAGALASSLAGRVAATCGVRTTMRAALVAVIVVLLYLAFGVQSLFGLVVILAIGGIANALAQPSVNLYLAERISRSRQGTAYGIKQSAIPVAGMLAGLTVPAIGLTIGWRWAFALFIIPPAVLSIYMPNARVIVDTAHSRETATQASRSMLGLIALAAGLGMAAGSSLGIFIVPGAVAAGWSPGQAGLVFAATSVIGVLGRLVCGIQADRRCGGHLRAVALMVLVGSFGFVALVLSNPVSFVIGASIAFGFGWGWTGLLIHAVVRLSPAAPAASTGLVQIGSSSGAVVGPLLFGYLVEHGSYSVAWATAGVELLLSSGLFIVAAALTRQLRPITPTINGRRP